MMKTATSNTSEQQNIMTEEKNNGITIEVVGFDEDKDKDSSDIQATIVEHWKESWKAAGYDDNSFVADWKVKTAAFLDAAQASGLHPRTFVAHHGSSRQVVASIHCQLWAGPLPWVVQSNAFQLGTVWGIHVSKDLVVDEDERLVLRKELLAAALKHLGSLHCSKVVTLAHTPMERDALVNTGVGFQAANMLTLDLRSPKQNSVGSYHDGHHHTPAFVCGPVHARFDSTVCSHWKKMWNEVGIPDDSLLPNMEGLTCSFLEMARKRLKYQTFLARCASTENVVGSVSCQIWEGPFPKIVVSECFQLGTIWAVYVDPKYRRQGVATTLMKQALSYLRDRAGCDTAILIAASEAGQRCYERLGFRPNNALVCDVVKGGGGEEASDPTEEKKDQQEGSATSSCRNAQMDRWLQQALIGLAVSVTSTQASAMRTATCQQLLSVFADHPHCHEIVAAVSRVQKKHGLYVDPNDNWFTQNSKKFGRGFNMKKLQSDPSELASKFDRLSTHYDHWTVGNRSKVESFIVQCAKANPHIVPLVPTVASSQQQDQQQQATPSTKSSTTTGTAVRILDVACGIGLQGQVLRLLGFQGELVGMDISSGMIQRVKERGCYNHAYVANANDNGTEEWNNYDVVICTGAMELLDQPRVLTQLASMAKTGGEVWLSFQHKTTSDPTKNPTRHQHVEGVTQDEAIHLLRQAGFGTVLSVETCPDAFYTPSPAQDGTLYPVPYVFITARKEG